LPDIRQFRHTRLSNSETVNLSISKFELLSAFVQLKTADFPHCPDSCVTTVRRIGSACSEVLEVSDEYCYLYLGETIPQN